MTFTVNVLFTCIIYCDAGARLWLELFASTADKFFSRVSYLPSDVFLQKAIRLSSEILLFLAAI